MPALSPPAFRSPRRRVRTCAAAAVAAILVTVSAACSSTPKNVAVVGDSITFMTKDQLAAGSDDQWDVAAMPGATAEQMQGSAAELATRPHDQAIVNLGTNDALRGVPLETTTASLQAIVDAFAGVECVHLVTITEQLPDEDRPAPQAAAAINEWIRQLDDQRDDVHVIDWQAETEGDGVELLEADHVHPNAEGSERLVGMVRDAAGGC